MAGNKQQDSFEAVLKDASKKSSSGGSILFKFSKTYPAYIILVITVVASFFVYNFMDQMVETDRKNAFDKAVTSVMTRFDSKYLTTNQILSSVKGLFDNSFVVRDVFELNGKVPTSTNSEIISINHVYRASNDYLEEFIFNARSQGYYDIEIHPKSERPEYYIVEYVVPFEGNEERSGFDFLSDPIATNKINQARDDNSFTATKVYEIRKGTEGFHLIAPVYMLGSEINSIEDRRENFTGALIIEIDAEKFFANALGSGIATDSTIIFEVFDVTESGDRIEIWESGNADFLTSGYKPYVEEVKEYNVADKQFAIAFYTVPNFGGEFQKRLPLLTFLGSIVTSFVLFGFVISVITSRARALDLAERMTRSQRRIVDASQDIISVLDFEGNWKSMNPAAETVFGIEPIKLIGSKINNLLQDIESPDKFYSLLNVKGEEATSRIDLQMKKIDGTPIWVNWSFTVSVADKLVYCIGRDVTLEKIQEEQAKLRSKQIQLAEQFSREASESKTYFLTKLGHQLRNSLTGIVGYLQLVSGKIYETEEELDSFIAMAEQSSEELFTFVSDLVDRAEQSDEASRVNIGTISFDKIIEKTHASFDKLQTGAEIEVEFKREGTSVNMVADADILSEALLNVYQSLSAGLKHCKIQINAQENRFEGATELQIISTANPLVSEMIVIYKNNKNKIIEALKFDKDDVMLEIATIDSNIRRMNGTMTVDTFGPNEGNVVMITLPLTKQAE